MDESLRLSCVVGTVTEHTSPLRREYDKLASSRSPRERIDPLMRRILFSTLVIACLLSVHADVWKAEVPAPGVVMASSGAGQEYAPGVVSLRFKQAYMPQKHDVSLYLTPRTGISGVDSLMARHNAFMLRKYLPSFDRYRFTSAASSRLERTFLMEYLGDADPAAVAEELLALACIESAHPDYIIELNYFGTRAEYPDDPKFKDQWNLHYANNDSVDIDAPEAWAIWKGSSNVVIGILDSGTKIDTISTLGVFETHSDLSFLFTEEDVTPLNEYGWLDINQNDATDPDTTTLFGAGPVQDNVIGYGRVLGGPGGAPGSKERAFWKTVPHNWVYAGQYDPGGPGIKTYFRHGVWVSGIAAATINDTGVVGVANECKVYVARRTKVLSTEILQLLHIADFADVINMSWGFCDDQSGIDDFKDATNHVAVVMDRVLVAASGNYIDTGDGHVKGCDGQFTTAAPARYPWVLSVGAIDSTLLLADYSVFTEDSVGHVSVVGPVDEGIPTSSHVLCGFDTQYEHPCSILETVETKAEGTSFAAPQATGVAALIMSRFPTMNQDSVRARIKHSAEWYWEDTPENHAKYGAGKINAYRAITEWGSIVGNVTWGPDSTIDSTYYISGDFTIEEGAKLTITEDVTVKIAPDHLNQYTAWALNPEWVEITVKGTLNADGVTFEAFNDSLTGTDWLGINFVSGSSGDLKNLVIKDSAFGVLADSASVTLVGCDITAGGDGVTVAGTSDVTMVDCVINAGAIGVEARVGSSVTIDSTTIYGSWTGIYALGDTLTCTNSLIYDIGNDGIFVNSTAVFVDIYNTTVNTAYNGIKILGSADVSISDCVIRENDTGVFLLWTGLDVEISQCDIHNNDTNGVYAAWAAGTLDMSYNDIHDNTVGVFFYGTSFDIGYGNSIEDNTTGIKCDGGADPVIEWNRITDNGTGVSAFNGSYPDLGNDGVSLGMNWINGDSTYHVANNNTPPSTLMAELNWWGQSTGPDTTKILGDVDYTPWETTAPGAPPSLVVELPRADPDMPGKFALRASYPNPFNPVTTIPYEVPPPGGRVQIAIYNVQGQQVRTLRSGFETPGYRSVVWQGRNDRGGPVATGVYFVRMAAPGFVETRKLVLLK